MWGGVGGEGGEGRAWRSAGSACCVGSAWGSLSVSIELCVHHAVVARGGSGGGGSAPRCRRAACGDAVGKHAITRGG